ncbi:MAG TPA: hypothetical protein VGA62_05520, partial [Acidimicrobiia bacterium]
IGASCVAIAFFAAVMVGGGIAVASGEFAGERPRAQPKGPAQGSRGNVAASLKVVDVKVAKGLHVRAFVFQNPIDDPYPDGSGRLTATFEVAAAEPRSHLHHREHLGVGVPLRRTTPRCSGGGSPLNLG